MHPTNWLRGLGISVAATLILYAGVSLYGDLTLLRFRASDVFAGPLAATNANASSGSFARLVSFDGDLLASDAARMTAQVIHHPASDASGRAAENKSAQDAVTAALKISPVRPALWLALGTLKAEMRAPATASLKMSYLTGAVPVDVAFSRLQTVTSTSAASDEEIRLLAQSDIRLVLASRARFDAPLVAVYVQASPEGKSLLLDATQTIDPKFNALLKKY
ncbi:hypothetical protein QA640_34685 [Bradyrhizobium sp. CB82]|uniref:hypothetical protein n=1 Tax=Bradyrhizobium sp. CB82 TaxID=3039159 RepID=UPI0024B1CB8B|nr:hypothetical protein [Bradyrhizobium sp. CB82]WFU39469.1 hypothetical protein QA640_34685 [Bradyrhizobium sp. CB82]